MRGAGHTCIAEVNQKRSTAPTLWVSRNRDGGLNFGAVLLSACDTIREQFAIHEPPKIPCRGNRPRLKPDNGDSGRAEHRILLGIPPSCGLAEMRPIIELHDALDR